MDHMNTPIRNLQTMLRTISLHEKNDCQLTPNGVYDPETIQAVTVFQQKHALPATGVTDQQTWDTVVGCYEDSVLELNAATPLQIDMHCSCVYRKEDRNITIMLAQCLLSEISKQYHCICCPGIHGTLDEPTAEALAEFQSLCGIPATGNLDKKTWKNLAFCFPHNDI